MAHAARTILKYVPMCHKARSPDTVFLVRSTDSPYTLLKRLPGTTRWGTSITISLPGTKLYDVLNIHGPFTTPEQDSLDTWIDQHTNVGILMGDFNDRIFLSLRCYDGRF